MRKIFKFTIFIIFIISCSQDNSTNPDSNFETIKIGTQVWMTKNLDVDHYRNGDPIQQVRNVNEWSNLKTGAWCYYYNDSTNGRIYGKLYNWYAVNDSRGLAPVGWHVPSDSEWKVMEIYIGMDPEFADLTQWRGRTEGGKLKSTGTIDDGDGLWKRPNVGATNEIGFSALPGGIRYGDGLFYQLNYWASWWTSTIHYYRERSAWHRTIIYGLSEINRLEFKMNCGLSVRCIKD